MKIIFFGSDDFALINLEEIARTSHDIVACVTQPDRSKGRGLKLAASPIKTWALENHVAVLQPQDLNEPKIIQSLNGFEADIFVVIAYGQFLPLQVLRIPKIASINSHASLLPKYRGAAPINWAIINGEKETGVTIIKMNEQMDAGDIIAQAPMKIDGEDTAMTLRAKLAMVSADILLKTMDDLELGRARFTPQDEKQVTLAPKMKKSMGLIDWNKDALTISNLIRGLVPWPSAYTKYNGKLVKVLEASLVPGPIGDAKPGVVMDMSREGILVAAKKDRLLLTKVHPESSKAMSAASFAAGYKIEAGFRMGN